MPTPGAAISGLRVCWSPAGPRLEKAAVRSSRSTAPTVRTEAAQPGEETVLLPGPELPAAMTKSGPCWESRSAAAASGSSQAVWEGSPRLMETTSALARAAHSMPAMIHESRP